MKLKSELKKYIAHFPEIDLPITITDDSKQHFSRKNKPLPEFLIRKFINPYELDEKEVVDEYTEYIPCFRLKRTVDMTAIVYWKGGLLTYEYFLCTYDKSGLQLARQKIAGLVLHGDLLIQAVANLDKDWIVHVVQNSMDRNNRVLIPDSTKSYSMELFADGRILLMKNDENS